MQTDTHDEEIAPHKARQRLSQYIDQLNASSSPNPTPLPTNRLRSFSPTKLVRLVKLDLSSCYLTDARLNQLLPELKLLPELTELNLRDNFLTGKTITLLFELFPQLEILEISKNKISQHHGCQLLSQFKKLRTLDISDNALKSHDIEELNASESLQIVSLLDNPNVDFVRHAKLLAGCDYNKKQLRASFYKTETLEGTKSDYILKNWESFKRRSLEYAKNPPIAKY